MNTDLRQTRAAQITMGPDLLDGVDVPSIRFAAPGIELQEMTTHGR